MKRQMVIYKTKPEHNAENEDEVADQIHVDEAHGILLRGLRWRCGRGAESWEGRGRGLTTEGVEPPVSSPWSLVTSD